MHLMLMIFFPNNMKRCHRELKVKNEIVRALEIPSEKSLYLSDAKHHFR
jgi:hypothetical protein